MVTLIVRRNSRIIRRKIWVVAGAILFLSVACSSGGSSGSSGSKGSEQLTGMTKDRACATIRELHEEARQAQADVVSGKVDMLQRAMVLEARIKVLAQSLESGELQVAVKQWAAAGDAVIVNNDSDQAESLRTIAQDARDRVDDLCGLPHGPR